MATAARTDAALLPSGEIRQVQELVRSILIADDLRDDTQILESVLERLCEIELELNGLAGKQELFEQWVQP